MKKRNIFLGVILAFSLTSCFDMDKMPEGVLSTAQPFSSTGEMRNYLDMFYQIGNPKYEDDKIKVNFGTGNLSNTNVKKKQSKKKEVVENTVKKKLGSLKDLSNLKI